MTEIENCSVDMGNDLRISSDGGDTDAKRGTLLLLNPDGLSGSKSNVPRFASVSPPSEDIRRSFDSGNALSEIMDKTDAFLKFYNNNYRPIYHLESMFIYLITKIYRYPNELKTST